ncbi:MAG TPA: Rieske 2Fe-2S domain-containing protein [Candidatus Limnocylindria bacterium]|nr:Rieske 2Fe-2S domain-containing protein [Candidatus Limnocylindria bacterium]
MLERIARPLSGLWDGIAAVVDGFYRALGRPGKFLQDFLNGTWLGHALHAVIVDVVVGASTAAVLLDVLRVYFGVEGLEDGTTWVLGLAWLAAVGAIITGLTDFKDTGPGDERAITGLHGVTNILGAVAFGLSVMMRIGGNHDAAWWSLLVGYLLISIGSFIGGHVVYKYGYMINHNAFSRGRRAKEFTPVMPVAELPESTPTKAMLGPTALVLVRRGDVVHALKETCSHAGGPLSKGELRGDTIQCPWHFSEFRLRDGSVAHGPAHTRAVRYEARINLGQVEVQGPYD